jgi:hypothetical protein
MDENIGHCKNMLYVGNSALFSFLTGLILFISLIWMITVWTRESWNGILFIPIYSSIVGITIILMSLCCIIDLEGTISNEFIILISKWAIYQSLLIGLSSFLCHNGIGIKALIRSLTIGLTWGLISGGSLMFVFLQFGQTSFLYLQSSFLLILSVFYSLLWLLPKTILHRRPALYHLAQINMFIFLSALLLIFTYYFLSGSEFEDEASCTIEVLFNIADIAQSYSILKAVYNDSLFWQGSYI